MSGRRAGRALAAALAVAVLPLAIAVGWTVGAVSILSTRWGSRIAVVEAARIYSSLIPGDVSLGASSGDLLGEWVLRDVRLRDARGDLLVEADSIRVDWSPLLIIFRIGDARRVAASGVRIHLWSDPSRGSFADLAVPGGSEQTSHGIGPDLPLFLRVGLELSDVELVSHGDFGIETLVCAESLAARLRAGGRRARLELAGKTIEMPGIGRRIESSQAVISWNEPKLEVEQLVLDTDLGTVRAEAARFDAESNELELRLVVDADEQAVRELAGLARLEDLGVEMEIGGCLERLEAKLRVEEAGRELVALDAQGAVLPRVDLAATLEIPTFESKRWIEDLDLSLGASGRLEFSRGEDGELFLDGSLECEGCRIGDFGSLRASVSGDLETVELSASLEKGGRRAAALDGTVRLGEKIELALQRLESRLYGVRLELARPALAVLHGGTISTDGIELRLGEGFVRASGKVDPEGRSDLELLFGELDLRDLSAVLPADLSGIAGGRFELSGRWSAISLEFRGELLRLGYRGRRIGSLRVQGGARGGRLEARGELSRSKTKVVSFSVQSPGELDLGASKVALPEGGRASGSIMVSDFDLSELEAFVPDLGLSGILNARVETEGPLDGPRLRVEGDVRALELRGEPLGDVDFSAKSARRRLTAELSLDGELAESVRAELDAGAIFDLSKGRVGLRSDPTTRARVVLESVRIDRLGGLVPRMDAGGEVDLSVELEGWPVPRRGRVELRARDASWRGAAIGDAEIEIGYGKGRVEGNGVVDGEIVDEVAFWFDAPIELRSGWRLHWLSDEEHELYAEISGVDLELASRLPGLLAGRGSSGTAEIDGRADGTIQVAGNARGPLVSIFVAGRDISRAGFDIGELDARLDLDEDGASIHGQLRGEGGRWLDARLRIPLEVDLEKGSLHWLHDRAHSATVELGRAGGAWIDAAAAERIAFDTSLSGILKLDGSAAHLSLQGGLEGFFTLAGGERLPLSLALSADEHGGRVDLSLGREEKAELELSGEADLDLARLARDREKAATGEALGETAFRLEAKLDGFDLSVLSPLLGDRLYDLRGALDGAVTASGTIADPVVGGELRLDGGEITVVDLNQRLRDISAALELDERVLRLSDLAFSSGRGKGAAAGVARLGSEGRLAARLRLALVRFPFVRPGLPEGTIDSKIEMDLSLDEESTEVEFSFSETEVRLLTQTASRAPRSVHDMENVVFLDEQRSEEPSGRSGDSGKMELSLDVSDSLLIEGPDVVMRWTGGATLAIDGEEAEASGGIRLTSGRFVLLGNDFRVEQGVLTLPGSGGGMPYIDLSARTETSEASVLVTVRGRVTRPELVLESDPPLTQYQILTLLLTGRTDTGEGGADEEKVRANAVSLLLAFDNTGLERELRENLGVDRISLGVGESVDQPILTVGKRIGDRVYVETEYHHNAPEEENSTTASVDLSIARNWVLETFYGDAQKGGIDIFWIKRFGKKKDEGGAEKKEDE
ncbi:MAG: translocation/assembly module TamB domain-containing protein [Polyangia bacterium]